MSSYLWIVRWRADYRPELPFPPLSNSFWDDPAAKQCSSESESRAEKRGMKIGLWAGAWHEDDDDDSCGDIAGVYVPFVPGFNRVFTHVRNSAMKGTGFRVTNHPTEVGWCCCCCY